MVSCLVAIDVQAGFIGPHTESVVPRIVELASSGRFDHVVATRFKNYPGSPYERFIGWDGLSDPESQAVFPALEALCERVFDKGSYGCFTPEFEAFLAEKDVDRLYLAGIDTDCCVLKSALDAFERNLDCKVLIDACASNGGPGSHEAAIVVMGRTIGEGQVVRGL